MQALYRSIHPSSDRERLFSSDCKLTLQGIQQLSNKSEQKQKLISTHLNSARKKIININKTPNLIKKFLCNRAKARKKVEREATRASLFFLQQQHCIVLFCKLFFGKFFQPSSSAAARVCRRRIRRRSRSWNEVKIYSKNYSKLVLLLTRVCRVYSLAKKMVKERRRKTQFSCRN